MNGRQEIIKRPARDMLLHLVASYCLLFHRCFVSATALATPEVREKLKMTLKLYVQKQFKLQRILDFRNHNYLCNPSLPLRPQLCATPSSLWEYLCTPLCFAPPTLQPSFSLRGYVCTPRLLCVLNSAPPLLFAGLPLHPP